MKIKNRRGGAPAWRDEVKVCPVCGEKFWPEERTTRDKWAARVVCSSVCGGRKSAESARERAEQTKRV